MYGDCGVRTTKKDDLGVITEPALVEHLINKIADKGYANITLVESQNVFGNWFENRDVKNVAKQAGYNPTNYHIVDLTMDVVAMSTRVLLVHTLLEKPGEMLIFESHFPRIKPTSPATIP